jgi:DNA-binding NtrC family response regulator
MPEGGRLTVTAQAVDGVLKAAVTDTGVGIPKELLNRIMEPLYSTKARGLGLGLAIARKPTAEEALAAGAWQVLPKPVDLPRLMAFVEEALGQPLVLIVDDDSDLCSNLWDLLRERAYSVAIAHDEEKAGRLLGEHEFQVVSIDMKLPRGDGRGVFQRVRKTNPEARTVVITGHRVEMGPMIQRVVAEGADAVCYKPFDVPHLLTLLQQLTSSETRP